MRIPLEPTSRARRTFVGVIFIIGGSAMILTGFTDLPRDVLKAALGILLGICILVGGVQYVLPPK
jgi:hypothetical protein